MISPRSRPDAGLPHLGGEIAGRLHILAEDQDFAHLQERIRLHQPDERLHFVVVRRREVFQVIEEDRQLVEVEKGLIENFVYPIHCAG